MTPQRSSLANMSEDVHETKQKREEGAEQELQQRLCNMLPELASSGPLSNSARVGIMVLLLGLKKATFTELMLAVKLPKSSLYKSLTMLEDHGLVLIRKEFLHGGRPRTVVQITKRGEELITRHLELMHEVVSKSLLSITDDIREPA